MLQLSEDFCRSAVSQLAQSQQTATSIGPEYSCTVSYHELMTTLDVMIARVGGAFERVIVIVIFDP